MNRIEDDINVLALVKKDTGERYVWKYTNRQKADALRALGRFAANSELSFSWYDAAKLSQKIRDHHPQ